MFGDCWVCWSRCGEFCTEAVIVTSTLAAAGPSAGERLWLPERDPSTCEALVEQHASSCHVEDRKLRKRRHVESDRESRYAEAQRSERRDIRPTPTEGMAEMHTVGNHPSF